MTGRRVLSTIRSARIAAAGFPLPLLTLPSQCAIPMPCSRHPGPHPGFGWTRPGTGSAGWRLMHHAAQIFEFQRQLIDLAPATFVAPDSSVSGGYGASRHCHLDEAPADHISRVCQAGNCASSRRRGRSRPRLEAASSGACLVSGQSAWGSGWLQVRRRRAISHISGEPDLDRDHGRRGNHKEQRDRIERGVEGNHGRLGCHGPAQ